MTGLIAGRKSFFVRKVHALFWGLWGIAAPHMICKLKKEHLSIKMGHCCVLS